MFFSPHENVMCISTSTTSRGQSRKQRCWHLNDRTSGHITWPSESDSCVYVNQTQSGLLYSQLTLQLGGSRVHNRNTNVFQNHLNPSTALHLSLVEIDNNSIGSRYSPLSDKRP